MTGLAGCPEPSVTNYKNTPTYAALTSQKSEGLNNTDAEARNLQCLNLSVMYHRVYVKLTMKVAMSRTQNEHFCLHIINLIWSPLHNFVHSSGLALAGSISTKTHVTTTTF
jgi:hypothetical protein